MMSALNHHSLSMVSFKDPDGHITTLKSNSVNLNTDLTGTPGVPTSSNQPSQSFNTPTQGPEEHWISNILGNALGDDYQVDANAHHASTPRNRQRVVRPYAVSAPLFTFASERSLFDKVMPILDGAVTGTTLALLQEQCGLSLRTAEPDGTPRPPTPPHTLHNSCDSFMDEDECIDETPTRPDRRVAFTLGRSETVHVNTGRPAPPAAPPAPPGSHTMAVNVAAWVAPVLQQAGIPAPPTRITALKRSVGQVIYTLAVPGSVDVDSATWMAMAALMVLVLADVPCHGSPYRLDLDKQHCRALLVASGLTSPQYARVRRLFAGVSPFVV